VAAGCVAAAGCVPAAFSACEEHAVARIGKTKPTATSQWAKA
jgi:hypothetical protein